MKIDEGGKNMEKIQREREWYDNPNLLTNLIIGLIAITLILSQAFAVKNNLGTEDILRSLLNYNSIYMLALVYFILIKTRVGRRYFNFLNLILIFVYFLNTFASFLTVFQSFGITSLLSCALNLILLFYLTYAFTRDTRFYQELYLDKVPFDEVTNEWYFYTIGILAVVILVADLIVVENFHSVVLSLFNCLYIMFFARYVYLYHCHLDFKKKKKKIEKTSSKKKKEVSE